MFPKASVRYKDFLMEFKDEKHIFAVAKLISEHPMFGTGENNLLGNWAAEPDPLERYRNSVIHSFEDHFLKPVPMNWAFPFVMLVDGRVVGHQSIKSTNQFDCFSTGSWILPSERGKGYGSVMRSMIYELGFQLGFPQGIASIHQNNKVSAKVTQKIGGKIINLYEEEVINMDGEPYVPVIDIWHVEKANFVSLTPNPEFEIDDLLEIVKPQLDSQMHLSEG